MNKEQALTKYEEYFGEPFFQNYQVGKTDEEIIQEIEDCIERDKTYIEILQEDLGEDADL